jgi:hypothetical protein
MQKRYSVMILKEAHALYSEEFPNKPVKLAKFCAFCALSEKHHTTMYAFVIITRM